MSFKVSLCINTNTLGHSNLWDYYNLVYQRDVFIRVTCLKGVWTLMCRNINPGSLF